MTTPDKSKSRKSGLLFALAGVAITIPALILAIQSEVKGIGFSITTRALFPFPDLIMSLGVELLIYAGFGIAFLQYPVAGWFIGASENRSRAALIYFFLHAAAFGLTFVVDPSYG